MSGYRKPKAEPPEAGIVECITGFAGKVEGKRVIIPGGLRLRADDPVVRAHPLHFIPSPSTTAEVEAAKAKLRARHDRPLSRAQSILRSVRGDSAA